MMQAKTEQNPVYQLRVVLRHTDPPVWRRFTVPSDITLHRLHLVLQKVMGWKNAHLYRFSIGSQEYGELYHDNENSGLDHKDSKRAKLKSLVAKQGSIFLYEYDFGDGWLHEVTLEAVLEPKPDLDHPACLAGERACPPEDCGGPPGFDNLLFIMNDPGHEEYQDMVSWLGHRFDPTAFSLVQVNRRLNSLRHS